MDEPLSKEQLQAIRERSRLVIAAREREAEAHKHMLHNPSAVRTFHALQDIRIEAEEDLKYHADEDIPTLLAHIDALEAELEAAAFAVDPPLDNKPTVIRRFRLTEVSSEDEAE